MSHEAMLGATIQKLRRIAGDIPLAAVKDLLDKMVDSKEKEVWNRELGKFSRKEPCWTRAGVLQYFATMQREVFTEPFETKKKFVVSAPEEVVGHMNAAFVKTFSSGENSVTEPIHPSHKLVCYRTRLKVSNSELLAALRDIGHKMLTITFARLYDLMSRTKEDLKYSATSDIPLHTKTLSNIFFVEDMEGSTCLVRLHWNGIGWAVWALPSEDSDTGGWPIGTRVFVPDNR